MDINRVNVNLRWFFARLCSPLSCSLSLCLSKYCLLSPCRPSSELVTTCLPRHRCLVWQYWASLRRLSTLTSTMSFSKSSAILQQERNPLGGFGWKPKRFVLDRAQREKKWEPEVNSRKFVTQKHFPRKGMPLVGEYSIPANGNFPAGYPSWQRPMTGHAPTTTRVATAY